MEYYDLPGDADGDAIRRLVNDGSNLSEPMEIDFHVAVGDGRNGELIASQAKKEGFSTKVVRDSEDGSWTVWCTINMLADYDEIIAIQKRLDRISVPYGGYSDGWGSFGNGQQKGV